MKKTIIRILCVILCMGILSSPLCVRAEQGCSLTLTYAKEQLAFSGLEIRIYRIADTDLIKLSPYDSYPVRITGITSQTEWSDIAAAFRGYIQADGIEPYMTAQTDTDGRAVFGNTEKGLYLVETVRCENGESVFTFYDFMIMLTEDVEARPKYSISQPDAEDKTYSVLKLWKDEGNSDRPVSVTVDLIKDGEVYDTVILDSSNNWSYSFTSDADSVWSVAERNIPVGYYVEIKENETSFVITNVLFDDEDDKPNDDDIDGPDSDDTQTLDENHGKPGTDTTQKPGADTTVKPGTDNNGDTTVKPGNKPSAPQTGDTFPMKFYTVMLCISGLLLLVLGFGIRRKEDA